MVVETELRAHGATSWKRRKKKSSLISLLLVRKSISWLVDHCKHAHHQHHHVAARAKLSRRIHHQTFLCAKGTQYKQMETVA